MSLTKVTYSMINGAPVNVKDFGAIGDGVADDTNAIQECINFALASSRNVFVPYGKYRLTSTITIPSSNGFKLQGEGFASTVDALSTYKASQFAMDAGIAQPVVWFSVGGDQLLIEGMSFLNGTSGLKFSAISGTGTFKRITVFQCGFLGQSANGIQLGYDAGVSQDLDSESNVIDQCWFGSGIPVAIYSNVLQNGYFLTLQNCISRSNLFFHNARAGLHDLKIIDCDVTPFPDVDAGDYYVKLSAGGGYFEINGLYCESALNHRLIKIENWSWAPAQSGRISAVHLNSSVNLTATQPISIDVYPYCSIEDCKVSYLGGVTRTIKLANGGVAYGSDTALDNYIGGTNITKLNRYGISFQNAPYYLNRYAENTWTPVLEGTTSAGVGTYTLQQGHYIVMGNTVFIQGTLAWTNHTGTGNMLISGLPFPAINTVGFPMTATSLTFASGTYISGFIGSSSFSKIDVYYNGDGVQGGIPMDTSAILYFQCFYQIA